MPFFPQRHKNKIILIFLSALLCLSLSSIWWLSTREGFLDNILYNENPINEGITQVSTKLDSYGTAAADMYTREMTRMDPTVKTDLIANELAVSNALTGSQATTVAPPNPHAPKTIYIGDAKYGQAQADYDLNTLATDIINQNPQQQLNWSEVQFAPPNTLTNTLAMNIVPSTPAPILVDSCSTYGILNSDFKTDICTTYASDKTTINEKCQELSADNCALPSCCVLVNGTCMAGNNNGPTFGTHNGLKLDYTYYYYKNKLYGSYEQPSSSGPNQALLAKEQAIRVAGAPITPPSTFASATGNFIDQPDAETTNGVLSSLKFKNP